MDWEGAMTRIVDDLASLVTANLITEDQAEAILAFVAAHESETHSQRVPLITEALGYLGAALALAAMVVTLQQTWEDMSQAVRLAIPLACALVLLAAGWALHRSAEPAFRRFAAALWFLSTASLGWLTAVIGLDIVESETYLAAWVGAVALALGIPLYALTRQAPQMLVLWIGALMIVLNVTTQLDLSDADTNLVAGLSVWILALAGLALTWFRVLRPTTLAYAIGGFVSLEACQALLGSEGGGPNHLGLYLGIATAAGLIALSVLRRETPLLVLGALALFGFLFGTIAHIFGETLGAPLVLLATGAILLGVAILTMRLRRFPGHHPPTVPTA